MEALRPMNAKMETYLARGFILTKYMIYIMKGNSSYFILDAFTFNKGHHLKEKNNIHCSVGISLLWWYGKNEVIFLFLNIL